jgi:hypothetical protein
MKILAKNISRISSSLCFFYLYLSLKQERKFFELRKIRRNLSFFGSLSFQKLKPLRNTAIDRKQKFL